MKVEIWSDVMCPFCYIGKRKFEAALEKFQHKDKVEIVWKSFQLSPDLKTDPSKNSHQFLAEHKGVSVKEAKQMNDSVAAMASAVGLTYNFDISIVANSFDAHRFSHFAKAYGKQNEVEEKLFAAYFTEGKNIADPETLVKLGTEIGLEETETRNMLNGSDYSEDVKNDILEASQIGVHGVPFFVLNRKYAISGAQDPDTMLNALEKAFGN